MTTCPLLFKARCFRSLISQGQVLKAEVPDVRTNPWLFREKLQVCESPSPSLWAAAPGVGFLLRLNLSFSYMWLSMFAEVKAAAQLTFMSFSEETVVAHVVVGPVSF